MKPSLILVLLMPFAAMAQDAAPAYVTRPSVPTPVQDKVNESLEAQRIAQAFTLIREGQSQRAIDGPLLQIISDYQAAYGNSPKRIYCASSIAETMHYLLDARALHVNAIALGANWSSAYYLTGFAYVNLGQFDKAAANLKRAVELSPSNAHFLSELGNLYESEKHWPEAMDMFRQAQTASQFMPDQNGRNREACRALRGQGYALVELHRLDEAVQAYQACLKIVPGDQKSYQELGYVMTLKGRQP